MNLDQFRSQSLGEIFVLAAKARRQELNAALYQALNGTVQDGPFKGMRLPGEVSSFDGDLASKLLGQFELELHEALLAAAAKPFPLVVNIGCTEGYYAVGLARLMPATRVIAFAANPDAQRLCRQAAELNGVAERVQVTGTCEAHVLRAVLAHAEAAFFIVDAEGAEKELLSAESLPNLRAYDLLVECHDFVDPSISSTLVERLRNTHELQVLVEGPRDPNRAEILRTLGSLDRWLSVCEFRPRTMHWLRATSRSLVVTRATSPAARPESEGAIPARFPALVVRDWGKIEIMEVPAYPVGPYDAVCKIEACSICAATDSHLVEGTFPRSWCSQPPFVLGHESAGRVVAVGPRVRNFRVGQLVVRPMWLPEGKAYQGLGSSWGGFATWGTIRDTWAQGQDTGQPTDYFWRSSQPLPDMPARDATLFVTWRDTLSCLFQLGLQAGQKLVIFGSGGNGLSFTRFAYLMGARVVMVGNPARAAAALAMGAQKVVDYRLGDKVAASVREAFGGELADAAIEAIGNPDELPRIAHCVTPGGKLYLFGIPEDLGRLNNLGPKFGKWQLINKTSEEWQAHGQVLTYYLTGQLAADDFSDATLPLAEVHEAFAMIRRREAAKITLTMPQ